MLLGGSTMGKSTCVTFAAYQSARWKCHRYELDGSHSYGHYFYTSKIAYHPIDGVDITATTVSDGKAYFKGIEIGTYTPEDNKRSAQGFQSKCRRDRSRGAARSL